MWPVPSVRAGPAGDVVELRERLSEMVDGGVNLNAFISAIPNAPSTSERSFFRGRLLRRPLEIGDGILGCAQAKRSLGRAAKSCDRWTSKRRKNTRVSTAQ
jgi:hypothetical protein